MDKQVTISPDVLFREVSGEMVLLDLASERYFGLDPVGSRIWQLLADNVETASIVTRLLEEFAVERETLEADMSELLQQLETAGLIRVG